MGSTIRLNDTLQITTEQGFPAELDIGQHLVSPYLQDLLAGQTFTFSGKDGVRNFQQPPVLNFWVQNKGGKHIYWGLIEMLRVKHDYLANTTSGQYRLHTLYTPEQMKVAARMVGLDAARDYFV